MQLDSPAGRIGIGQSNRYAATTIAKHHEVTADLVDDNYANRKTL
jgi:hypothetical protein